MVTRPPRVAVVGTFDVENFGDLLFPLIARHELTSRIPAIEVVPYSYHPQESRSWPYEVRPLAELGDDVGALDLVLVGGGHLIRFDKRVAFGYLPPGPDLHHPTAYALMPTLLASWAGVPVAWNAVGVSPATPAWAAPLLAEAARGAAYLAVRDEPSAAEMRRVAPDADVVVVPDSAFGLAALRPASSTDAVRARAELGLDGPYVVYQPSPDLAPHRSWLVAALRSYAERGLTIVELPVSPALGDAVGIVDVETPTVSPTGWPPPLALAGLVAGAEAVIARSLHLSIAAVTAGVPVVRRESEADSKYRLLDGLDGVHVVTGDAPTAELPPLGRHEVGADVRALLETLDRHWSSIAALVGRRRLARTAALAATIGRLTQLEEDAAQATVAERDLDRAFADRDLERSRGAFVQRKIGELEALYESTETQLQASERRLQDTQRQLQGTQLELREVKETLSWRVTSPLRTLRAAFRRSEPPATSPAEPPTASDTTEPEPAPSPAAPPEQPVEPRATAAAPLPTTVAATTTETPVDEDEPTVHVPLLENAAELPMSAVRKVAFYLPQFHPIEENDRWWGRGFTEWTNVTKAQPLFEGHVQPKRPGELGYYDLRAVEVQRRQVELARLYGIDAFCFHFYWFGGRRLLERPLDQYLADPTLDLPFCLCWANESWSRRWDGRDEEDLLIEQRHSETDDVAFIDDVTRYLDDPRYVRVDGRPLLVIYRPGLLPDAPATVGRWRERYRTTRGGELFVAHAMAFDDLDPAVYGCDASIEFPPVRLGPSSPATAPRIEEGIVPLSDEGANVFDGQFFVEESRRYTTPKHLLFRGVCPGWDNTPRRGSAAYVLGHTSPAGFQTWLRNALVETSERLPPDQQLVFVNAWNEWGEGCYLEPDERLGYAYLEAVRVASVREAARPRPSSSPPGLLVVTSRSLRSEVEPAFRQRAPDARVLTVDDGGDFVALLESLRTDPSVRPDDILILLGAGRAVDAAGAGQSDVHELEELLDVHEIRDAFERDPGLGVVGANASRRPLWELSDADVRRVGAIARRLGAFDEDVLRASFFDGPLLFLRAAALAPLRAIAIGQEELTADRSAFATAAARCVELSAYAAGYRVEDTRSLRLPNVSTSRSKSATNRG